MKKIPTIFLRDTSARKPVITPEWDPQCLWVCDGEAMATRKWDGSACLIHNGKFYRRLEWDAKKGPPPSTWLHHDFNPAAQSGHGWIEVGEGSDDWMHRLVSDQVAMLKEDGVSGTFELIGEKVNKNREGLVGYRLMRHGDIELEAPREFDALRSYLAGMAMEGVVWHHPDGRMAKIKRRDFGLPW